MTKILGLSGNEFNQRLQKFESRHQSNYQNTFQSTIDKSIREYENEIIANVNKISNVITFCVKHSFYIESLTKNLEYIVKICNQFDESIKNNKSVPAYYWLQSENSDFHLDIYISTLLEIYMLVFKVPNQLAAYLSKIKQAHLILLKFWADIDNQRRTELSVKARLYEEKQTKKKKEAKGFMKGIRHYEKELEAAFNDSNYFDFDFARTMLAANWKKLKDLIGLAYQFLNVLFISGTLIQSCHLEAARVMCLLIGKFGNDSQKNIYLIGLLKDLVRYEIKGIQEMKPKEIHQTEVVLDSPKCAVLSQRVIGNYSSRDNISKKQIQDQASVFTPGKENKQIFETSRYGFETLRKVTTCLEPVEILEYKPEQSISDLSEQLSHNRFNGDVPSMSSGRSILKSRINPNFADESMSVANVTDDENDSDDEYQKEVSGNCEHNSDDEEEDENDTDVEIHSQASSKRLWFKEKASHFFKSIYDVENKESKIT
ncbi:hypothetical protein FOA43_002324 [Brettanomyces nanus]|uniref:Uncharacterized protein n=1 Tax=Eeniella nana TaxID=13502 RepID=A0A875S731_EENNA|nr:uncharacterized protein FOA43_002324 [Brettanomyces nanus]QPG74984.1 hypothetical protein FOA43_002324 [Brettanomyces nanus]